MTDAEAAQELGEQGTDATQADDGDLRTGQNRLPGVPEQPDLTVKIGINAARVRPWRWSDTA